MSTQKVRIGDTYYFGSDLVQSMTFWIHLEIEIAKAFTLKYEELPRGQWRRYEIVE